MPVEVKVKGGTVPFETDEHVRRDGTPGEAGQAQAGVRQERQVTAGNASSINDAAAAVVLMERGAAEQRGLKPLGRLVAYATPASSPGTWASARCRRCRRCSRRPA